MEKPRPDSRRENDLQRVINVLPLTKRQYKLAQEAITVASPEKADRILSLFSRITEHLPDALAKLEALNATKKCPPQLFSEPPTSAVSKRKSRHRKMSYIVHEVRDKVEQLIKPLIPQGATLSLCSHAAIPTKSNAAVRGRKRLAQFNMTVGNNHVKVSVRFEEVRTFYSKGTPILMGRLKPLVDTITLGEDVVYRLNSKRKVALDVRKNGLVTRFGQERIGQNSLSAEQRREKKR